MASLSIGLLLRGGVEGGSLDNIVMCSVVEKKISEVFIIEITSAIMLLMELT